MGYVSASSIDAHSVSISDPFKTEVLQRIKNPAFNINFLSIAEIYTLIEEFITCPVLMLDIPTHIAFTGWAMLQVNEKTEVLRALQTDSPESAGDNNFINIWLFITLTLLDQIR